MEKLLSNGMKHQTLPQNFVFPPDQRPGNLVSSCKSVPVIDLKGGGGADIDKEVSEKILQAGRDFGFFQVVNHGVPEELLQATMGVAQEFFDMPREDKAIYYSEDMTKIPRISTSYGPYNEDRLYWRDSLNLLAHRQRGEEDLVHIYPHKPDDFRDIFTKYTTETMGLGIKLLKLTCKAIGLEEDHFSKDLSRGPTQILVNHYPPCPDPTLTLGLASHCDPNLITLLLQGTVTGLQVFHDGQWLLVDPIPNAYIVNFGYIMEIVTNGVIKSVEHRAVTNSSVARTTIVTFMTPEGDCVVAPAESLVNKHGNHPISKPLTYNECFGVFVANGGDREKVMKALLVKD